MARTLTNTGISVPDEGDANPDAAKAISGNGGTNDIVGNYDAHRHRGPANNEPPGLDGDSFAMSGDLDIDMNGASVSDTGDVNFRDSVSDANIPNGGIGIVGNPGVLKFRDLGGTLSNIGLGGKSIEGDYAGDPNASFRYSTAQGRYDAFANFGATQRGFEGVGGVDFFEPVSGAVDRLRLRVPTNWDADATGDKTINWPSFARVDALTNPLAAVLEIDTWTPQITFGGAQPTYTNQNGFYCRILDWVIYFFDVAWTGGAVSSPTNIQNLRFSAINTGSSSQNWGWWTGFTASPNAQGTFRPLSGTIVELRDFNDNIVTGEASSFCAGAIVARLA